LKFKLDLSYFELQYMLDDHKNFYDNYIKLLYCSE